MKTSRDATRLCTGKRSPCPRIATRSPPVDVTSAAPSGPTRAMVSAARSMRRSIRTLSLSLLLAIFGRTPVHAAADVAARNGDASIEHDRAAGTWTIKAGGAALTLALDATRDFALLALISPAGRAWALGAAPDSFVRVGGRSLPFGNRASGFAFDGADVAAHDNTLQLSAAFTLGDLRITRHYAVVPGAPAFEAWTTYAARSATAMSDLNALQLTVPAGAIHWVTGLQWDAAGAPDGAPDAAFTLQTRSIAAGVRHRRPPQRPADRAARHLQHVVRLRHRDRRRLDARGDDARRRARRGSVRRRRRLVCGRRRERPVRLRFGPRRVVGGPCAFSGRLAAAQRLRARARNAVRPLDRAGARRARARRRSGRRRAVAREDRRRLRIRSCRADLSRERARAGVAARPPVGARRPSAARLREAGQQHVHQLRARRPRPRPDRRKFRARERPLRSAGGAARTLS